MTQKFTAKTTAKTYPFEFLQLLQKPHCKNTPLKGGLLVFAVEDPLAPYANCTNRFLQ